MDGGVVRLALVGAGRMGRIHADVIARDVPEGRLVAVADVDPDAARTVAEATGAARYLDHRAAFEHDLDAVVIVTPTADHLAIIEDAVAAGLDVFCEKPIALTVEETQRAVELAQDAAVRLQVGLYRRHDADYQRARDRIREGAIGTPELVRSLQYDTFVPPLAFCDPVVSGGIPVDMGIHELDIASWLLDDDIVEVHAFGSAISVPELRSVGDVDTCLIGVRFRSGAIGSIELVRDVGYAEDVRTEVVGTDGSVLVGTLPGTASMVTAAGRLVTDAAPSVFARFRPALVAQLQAFCRAILEDGPVEPPAEASIGALAAGIAARRSLETGTPIRL